MLTRISLGGIALSAMLAVGYVGGPAAPAMGRSQQDQGAALPLHPAARPYQIHSSGASRVVSWIAQVELPANDRATDSLYGISVAVDGSTAVVGASGHYNLNGAAYVFVHSGTGWQQQAVLTARDGTSGDFEGNSVALSRDTAVVGALGYGTNTGRVYVFVRDGTAWERQATLVAPDASTGDFFGYSVAIDGDTAVIGARDKHNSAGAAYIFVRNGSDWSLQARLPDPSGTAGDQFGSAVAIDASTAIVGAPGHANHQGAAYIYTLGSDGMSWHLQSTLTMGSGQGGFGGAVDISGGTAIVGAYGQFGYLGEAGIFVRRGNTWSRQATLTLPASENGAAFGSAVAIDKDTAVVGAPGQDEHLGAAYVFGREGTTWNLLISVSDPVGIPGENYGGSVALDADTALVGAKNKSNYTGATYVLGGSS